MTTHAVTRSYSIKEASALTGLPASTLRYYEQVGVISPISRGASSKHRVYDERDLDQLMSVACLSGMSVSDMRQYMANARAGAAAAADQQQLLEEQQRRLATEAEALALRQRYVAVKVAYWQSVRAGDQARTEQIQAEASRLADELRQVGKG